MARRTFRVILVILIVFGLTVVVAPTQASAAYTIPIACKGKQGKLICVSKQSHRLYALKNGRIAWVQELNMRATARARVGAEFAGEVASDGEAPPATKTREGSFSIISKKADTYSSIYPDARMRYYMKYHWKGQGIHYSYEYARTGYPFSHGCVGLKSIQFARWLYYWAPIGTRVIITSG